MSAIDIKIRDHRLELLGYECYADYLESNYWKRLRFIYLNSKRAKNRAGVNCCEFCGCIDQQLDLHHKTYERLGCEKPDDVVLLCREDHQAIHDREFSGFTLIESTEYIRRRRDGHYVDPEINHRRNELTSVKVKIETEVESPIFRLKGKKFVKNVDIRVEIGLLTTQLQHVNDEIETMKKIYQICKVGVVFKDYQIRINRLINNRKLIQNEMNRLLQLQKFRSASLS